MVRKVQLGREHMFYTRCKLALHINYIWITPDDGHYGLVSIDRRDLTVGTNRGTPQEYCESFQLGTVEGIIGIKRLVKRSYLLAVGSSSLIDPNTSTYKIDSVRMYPIEDVQRKSDESYKDELEWKWEEIYLEMIRNLFKKCNFYYSACYDLTNSLQRNYEIKDNLLLDQPYCFSNKSFQWNHNLLELFDSSDKIISKCRLPIIMGFYTSKPLDANGCYKWLLISRRGIKRAGTRYNKRGVDDDGNVANFVETEQIVHRLSGDGGSTSYVQIRGSIPMFWSQRPTYKYKPAIEIHYRDHEVAMERHYRNLMSEYGKVSVACLIDSKGHEARIAKEFSLRMNNLQLRLNIPYHYFDFHKECSKMRWHRLKLLIDKLEPEIKSYGLFSRVDHIHEEDKHYSTKQTGVVRTNCIDSLDRTNVVQSMIAQYVLEIQLRKFGNVSLSYFPSFMQIFKDAWADNADALSIQYAGTPALKTDFTRTGQRTYSGLMRDGVNSLTRYVSNNYLDNYLQDSMDLILGNFVGYPSPTYRPLDLAHPSALPIAIVMITLIALYVYFRHNSMRLLDN